MAALAPALGDRIYRLLCTRWGLPAVTVEKVTFAAACLFALLSAVTLGVALHRIWRQRRRGIALASASLAFLCAVSVGAFLLAGLSLDISLSGTRAIGEPVGEAVNVWQLGPH